MKARYAFIAGAAAMTLSSTAHAAHADYYLKIEGVDGEAKVAEWSFGACNAGQCSTIASPRDAASGLATGKRQDEPRVTASQNTQSLRESPTRRSSDASAGAGADAKAAKPPRSTYNVKNMEGARLTATAGDLDGDGMADLDFAATQDEVSGFTLTFQKIEATWRTACTGRHIAKASLRTGQDSYELSDVTVACTDTTGGGTEMKLSGGALKNTKGHVTLMR